MYFFPATHAIWSRFGFGYALPNRSRAVVPIAVNADLMGSAGIAFLILSGNESGTVEGSGSLPEAGC